MNQDTLDKAVSSLQQERLDAFVVCSPENFAYLAGFVVPSHSILRWRHSMIIVTADGNKHVFTVDMEESTVKQNLPGVEVRSWREFADCSMVVLADYLKELGLENAKLGLELDYLPARDLERLSVELPSAALMDSSEIFSRMRFIKTTREIDLLRRLSRISDKAINDAYQSVGLGSSEMDIAAALTRSIYRQGAQDFKFMIVATGERSQLPNVGPSLRKLEMGDICRVEIFSIVDGYHAGVCRSASVGDPSPEADEIWSILANATRQLVSLIEPGVPTSDVYRKYLKLVEPLDMPPIDFAGHGIGLHLHEHPYLADADPTVLEAGMVMGIEPLIYKTGHGFGLQNKDMVLVTETGCELLSDYTNTKELIRVS
ncbi:MAG: Xaa-Pro peptidase family protein [Albidovulum sp.]|nr:Xaa-Pro peptidase family protein [Albidovulum sp.]MDE0530508.1 Xaa-Pro peptidase family protein [Albidovulum sp.]